MLQFSSSWQKILRTLRRGLGPERFTVPTARKR
jgi:hypothetical protein